MNSIITTTELESDRLGSEDKECIRKVPDPACIVVLRKDIRGTKITPIPIRCRPWYLFVKLPVIVLITIAVARALSEVWYAVLFMGVLFFLQAKPSYNKKVSREFQRRKTDYETALNSFVELSSRLAHDESVDRFNRARLKVDILQKELLDLPGRAELLGKQIFASAEVQQMDDYLRGFRIEDASIAGFGRAKKEALRYAGIETAADIRDNVDVDVVGIGSALRESLSAWRDRCAAQFVFDRRAKSLLVALDSARRDLISRRDWLRESVLKGHYRLEELGPPARTSADAFVPQAADLAYRLEQFRMDYELVGGSAYATDKWQGEQGGPLIVSAAINGFGEEFVDEVSPGLDEAARLREQPFSFDSSGDELLDAVIAFVLSDRRPSISLVQRKFAIGYNRAARLLEMMEGRGLLSPLRSDGTRDILV